ncbi:unnamed protein product [Rhodiola kirilowii]
MDDHNAEQHSSHKRKRSTAASFCISCCFRKRNTSSSNNDCASENHQHHRYDRPQPKLLRTSSTWLKARMSDLPEIRDRYRSIVSKLGRTQRRHASDFSYDAFSYALNFDDDSRADEFPPRSFSARLPPTPRPLTEEVDATKDGVGVVSSPRPIGEFLYDMAFEQNGIPVTLRPLNIVRPVANTVEESYSDPVTTNGRNVEGMSPNSGFVNVCGIGTLPVYYTSKVPESSLAAYPASGASYWTSQVPAAGGGNPLIGVDCGSGLVGNMMSGNASDQASEDGGDDSSSGKKVKFMCSIGGKILPRPNDGVLRYIGGETRIITVRKDISFEQLMLKMANTYGQLVALKYQLPDEDLDALVSVSCPDDLENMMEEYEKLVERSLDGSARLRVFLFPASELEFLGMPQFEDVSGVKYVDVVNGMLDDVGGSLTRKESIASAESPLLSGAEAADISGPFSQGDVSELPSTGMLSPAESITASQENTPRLASAEPVPTIFSDSTAIPVGVPLVSSAVTQPHSVLPENQFGSYLQQPVLETSQPHPPSYFGHPTMVYPHQQLLRTALPVFPQQQQTGNIVAGNMHHITSAPQVVATPTLRTNVTHPLMQCPPGVMNNYSTGNTPPRAFQVPVDGNYAHTTYAAQIPSSVIRGPNEWRHFHQNQSILLGAPSPHQPVTVPETFPKYQGCYMCQRALPHAHSDMLVYDSKDGLASPISDSNSNNSGFSPGDNLGAASSKTMSLDSKAPREVHSDQVLGAQMRVIQTDPRLTSPLTNGMPQNFVTYSYQPIIPPNSEYLGNPRMMLPQSSGGLDVQSPFGMVVGNIPRSVQHLVANPSGNKLLYNGVPPAGGIPFQPAQHVVYSKPGGHPPEVAGIVPRELAVDTIAYNSRTIDEQMDKLSVNRENVIGTRDVLAKPTYGELMEHKPIEEPLIPGIAKNGQISRADIQAPLQTEVQYQINHPPTEPHTVVKQPSGGAPGPYTQLNIAPPQSSPNLASHINPSDGAGVLQDSSNSLFSNQDPWNMWQEVHFRPRVPTRFGAANEPFGAREEEPSEDHFGGNFGAMNMHTETPPGNMNKYVKEPVARKGEPITRETGGFCIDVAASTPQSAAPYGPDVVNMGSKPDSETNQVKGAQTRDLGVQRSPKFEDARVKLLDPGNLGFPESNGLGRLQIISNNDLEELQELGSGTFGTVYHGKWRGSDVAIKRISNRCFMGKPSEQDRMRKDFWNEAVKLADLHHPNVVAFYGVVLDGPGGSMATVTEYMVNGSLRNALQKNERCLDKRKRLLILMDVAFGMEYLHGKNIVHFDLKSDNLLVNLRDSHRPVCKVGDLGLSKVKCKTLISGGVRGTLPWMAPELLNGSSSLVSEKVDVYSFGIVMWELLTGEEPYADLHYGTIIGGIVSNTLRPTVPETCDPEWRSIMEKCWSAEPSERPNFTEAANQLRAMATKIQKLDFRPSSFPHFPAAATSILFSSCCYGSSSSVLMVSVVDQASAPPSLASLRVGWVAGFGFVVMGCLEPTGDVSLEEQSRAPSVSAVAEFLSARS